MAIPFEIHTPYPTPLTNLFIYLFQFSAYIQKIKTRQYAEGNLK